MQQLFKRLTRFVNDESVRVHSCHDLVEGVEVRIIRGRAANQDVILRVPADVVLAGAANHQIATRVPLNRIVAAAANENVVTVAAAKRGGKA